MYKTVLAICIALICSTATYAQLVTGTVKDAKTKQPLSFVNVGVVGKGLGTVTNDAGTFSLALEKYTKDSLRVSILGYKSQSFLVADILKNPDVLAITLLPDAISLKEVKIKSHKWKGIVLGNTTKSQGVAAELKGPMLGFEIGVVIPVKKSPAWLKRFNCSIINNMQGDSVRLRLNVYSVKDGMPDKNILQQNIYTTVFKGDKEIIIDLEPYNIKVDGDFFVSLETIQSMIDVDLRLSASVYKRAPSIVRSASQSSWGNLIRIGVGFNVLIDY
ncbi:MAG: carboxypeptidase-like regulatory domain-containing protein [Bacteroidota bacterium]